MFDDTPIHRYLKPWTIKDKLEKQYIEEYNKFIESEYSKNLQTFSDN